MNEFPNKMPIAIFWSSEEKRGKIYFQSENGEWKNEVIGTAFWISSQGKLGSHICFQMNGDEKRKVELFKNALWVCPTPKRKPNKKEHA